MTEDDGARTCAAAIIPRPWVAGHGPEVERRLSDAAAERAERLEKAAGIIRAYRDRAVDRALAAQAGEIERLRGALAHYAHIGTLGPETTGTKAKRGRIGPDLGAVAREALAGTAEQGATHAE